MPDSYSIYDAKANFSMIARDAAEHGKVFVVANAQRKAAPRTVILGEEAVRILLDHFVCHSEWEEDAEHHLWTVYVPEIDDWGQGESQEDAVKDLVDGAMELADLYLSDLQFFLRGGRSAEFPFMLKISLARDAGEVRKVLGLWWATPSLSAT
jgi:hypothetical protein